MELVDRVRAELPSAVEKRMFGGTEFVVEVALVCSVSARGLPLQAQRDGKWRPWINQARGTNGKVHD